MFSYNESARIPLRHLMHIGTRSYDPETMIYQLTKSADVSKTEKFEMKLDVYPNVNDWGIVLASTETGHNQEFYSTKSTFTYIILEGNGSFFLNDEEIPVSKGDCLTIEPNTRIYYKGKIKLVLITTPAWKAENEIETKASIW